MPLHPDSYRKPLVLGLLALLVVITYLPSLEVPFTFDDMPNIVLNPSVHAEKFSDLGRALHSEVSASRPLAMLSFALNHWFGGLDIFGYHLFNLLLHLANTILLYHLLLILPATPAGKDRGPEVFGLEQRVALLAAALWAVNPVQTQAVTYIVQRMTGLATFFYLAGLYGYVALRRGKLSAKVAFPALLCCFVLGLASKEIVLTLPLALMLMDFVFFPESFRKNLPFLAGAIFLSFLIGLYYLQGRFPEWLATYPGRNFSPLERVMTQWRLLWHYLSLFLVPLPDRLHLTYNFPVSRGLWAPWTTSLALVGILATLFAAVRFREKYPVLSWAILFFFVAAAPEASFVNLELAFVHRLYLPSLFLAFAALYYLPPAWLRKAGFLLLLLVAIWSYWTINRNEEWQNGEKFWASNIDRGAETARAKNNLASVLIDAGRFEEALSQIEAGLKLASRDEDLMLLMYNQAYALFYLQEFDKSLEAFRKTAKRFGAYRHTYLFIGMIYLKQGRVKKALELADQLEAQPALKYQGEIIKANVMANENRNQEAIDLLKRALAAESEAEIYIRQRLQLELVGIYMKEGRFNEAYRILLEITERFPQNYSVWRMIYMMLAAGGDRERAEKVKAFLESRGVRVNNAPRAGN